MIRISGKNLGSLTLPGACHRCFWIKHNLKSLPFSIFPGIFSTFDSFNKQIVHSVFDSIGKAPEWLASLGDFKGYIDPPSHQNFQHLHEETEILITGSADGIFVGRDDRLTIVDYKTAKFTSNQDKLLPMYEMQLNCYALIAETLGLGQVSSLALVYFDPSFAFEHVREWERNYGFDMGFSVHLLPVKIDRSRLVGVLQLAREILSLQLPPYRTNDCKDCQALDNLQHMLNLS